MTDWPGIATLATEWDDGGLWDDVVAVASRAWAAPAEDRRVEWNHLVLAVGNFKRQRGRRLRPAPVAIPPTTDRAPAFDYPLANGRASVNCEDRASWYDLERNLPGAAAATTTTLLAALWPDAHLILDWRVLAVLIGLQHVDSVAQAPPFESRASGIAPLMEQYPWVRSVSLEAAHATDRPVRDLERGLYKLSQRVASEAGRSWEQYGLALQASLGEAGNLRSGEDGAEET